MSLITAPFTLACTSEWLRDQSELTALVADRVYTELPKTKVFPLVRVNQIADPPVIGHVHWAFDVLLQVDVYGGSKALTWQIAETVRGLLSQRYPGAHDLDAGYVVVNAVRNGGIRFSTEDIEGHPRPRGSFDTSITVHP